DGIVWLDADTGQLSASTDVFDEPYGVASSSDGKRLYVTLDYPGRLVTIDTEAKQVESDVEVGKFTRGLALSADDQVAYVTEYYRGNVIAVDLSSAKVVDEWPGISNDNLARQIVLHPIRPKAYLAHIRSRVTAVHGEGSIFPYVSVISTERAADGAETKRRRRLPMDSFSGARVTANPWDCAISPDGTRFYVVFAGTDDMFVCNVIDDNYRELTYRDYLRVGHNPRAVCVSPDSAKFYVYNALDMEVVEYDAESLRTSRSWKVTSWPYDEAALRGKILFYSALQPMASRRWISCASCHPDGDPDGRTWHNPEGLRNTQSLAGMAWTHPIHWSADRDEVQDFEHTIRGKLMQGRGLLPGELQAELGDANRGRSTDLDALARYSNSHEYALSPHAKTGLSEAAVRGREIFFSETAQCATCHGGPMYTDSQPRAELLRHNVGTGDDPAEKLPPDYDTPSLLGVYRSAPYLHHGKAETLAEVLTTFNANDQHGKTSHLSQDQIADLVEFLKSLPYEDPVVAARAANLTQVRD
ncbi:MAG: c-type cytochrome, partial [Planctomycetales bacterium]|nr:c-type cytochrome [Planctomycetales bacterium]